MHIPTTASFVASLGIFISCAEVNIVDLVSGTLANDACSGEEGECGLSLRQLRGELRAADVNEHSVDESETTDDQEHSADVKESGYEFMGRGSCVDADGHEYERWYAGGPAYLYFADGDASKCGCPECADICDRFSACLGYRFSCCPKGVRCRAGASILFSRGTRPAGPAPGSFSIRGFYDTPTTGNDFPGVGRINRVDSENWLGKCFRREAAA